MIARDTDGVRATTYSGQIYGCNDAIAGENFEGHVKGLFGDCMRVAAHKHRTVNAMHFPIAANRLNDRQDVIFVERGGERGTAVPRRAEGYPLSRDRDIGLFLKKSFVSLPASSASDGSISVPARASTGIAGAFPGSATHDNIYAMGSSVILENNSVTQFEFGAVCGKAGDTAVALHRIVN